MTQPNRPLSPDEKLSDFADQALGGTLHQPASDPAEEGYGLEETVLRLRRVMPTSALEESTKKQMLARLNARIAKEQKESFWTRLFSLEWIQDQYRPQFAIATGVLALLIVGLVFLPIDFGSTDSITGTALKSGNQVWVIVGLVALFCALLWFTRRK
ncbi:MAG: hypothetical protein IT310_12315 [Anaerolineales bacterium]|nr:hypothetical protein [Anaerolineales bacterium]